MNDKEKKAADHLLDKLADDNFVTVADGVANAYLTLITASRDRYYAERYARRGYGCTEQSEPDENVKEPETKAE